VKEEFQLIVLVLTRISHSKQLKHIIQLYPEAVIVNSPRNGLPIHLACTKNLNLDLVKYLELLYPESLDFCK